MRFPLNVALRYLFGKKSTNAINIITGVSIVGIGVGTAALILVLSVFNGFESLLASLMNTVNADLKISPERGKTFIPDSNMLDALATLPGVESISLTLEETAMIEYEGNQDFCVLKGVDDNYKITTTIDSAIIQGEFKLHDGDIQYLVMGGGLSNRLNVNVRNVFKPVTVYTPKKKRGPADAPFKRRDAYPIARFSIKQDYDYTYVFSSLEFARELLSLPRSVSAIELNTSPDFPGKSFQEQIGEIVGEGYQILDRYEQNDALFKLMRVEKWLSYAIAGLTLFIVSFNLIGALWMIVLDKKQDLSILKAMGATSAQIYRLVLYEGLLVSGVGIVAGVALALILYALQVTIGIVRFPEGFVVEAYPVVLQWTDFLVVGLTVLGIGYLASVLPARRGSLITAYVREE